MLDIGRQKPLISVVLPIYNEATNPLLPNTLYSIIYQSYKNIELIIVDDCSNDGSIYLINNILKKSRERFGRVLILRNEKNQDIAKTLNRGINASRGTYICRIDAGDIMHKDRLTLQQSYMQQKKYLWITGTLPCFVNCKIESTERSEFKRVPTSSYEKLAEKALYRNYILHSTWLVRRELYHKIGLYNADYRCEDYEFWLRALSQNYYVEIIPKYLTYVLEREAGGISRLYRRKMQVDRAKVKWKYIKYFPTIHNFLGLFRSTLGIGLILFHHLQKHP